MSDEKPKRRGKSLSTQLQEALNDAATFSKVREPDELSISRLKSATQRIKTLSILASRKKVDLIRKLKDELKTAKARITELESQLASRPAAVTPSTTAGTPQPTQASFDGISSAAFDERLQQALDIAKGMAKRSATLAPPMAPAPSKPAEKVILPFRTEEAVVPRSAWRGPTLDIEMPQPISPPTPSLVDEALKERERVARVTVADIEASVVASQDLSARYVANQKVLAELRAKQLQEDSKPNHVD
jgi:hypothetical protein